MANKVTDMASKVFNHPLGRTAVLGGGLAGAGYVGSKYLGRFLVKLLFADKPTKDRDEILKAFDKGGRYSYLLPAMGAIAGTVLANAGTVDTSKGWFNREGMGKITSSMIDGKYWQRPENQEAFQQKMRNRGKLDSLDNLILDSLQKTSSSDYNFNSRIVPITFATSTINKDSYLRAQEKEAINGILLKSNDYKPGIVSPKNIMSTALNAGVNFGVAYGLGKVTGTIFGLPSPIVNRLSVIGGIAAGLKGTGII